MTFIAAATGIAGILTPVIDRLFPDPVTREKAMAEIRQMDNEGELERFKALLEADKGQMEVNKQEASHASIFVAGWRPFIGWVCGLSMAYEFIFLRMLNWIVALSGHTIPPLPELPSADLSNILMAMLGIGTMRTIEKVQGVSPGMAPVHKLPWQK